MKDPAAARAMADCPASNYGYAPEFDPRCAVCRAEIVYPLLRWQCAFTLHGWVHVFAICSSAYCQAIQHREALQARFHAAAHPDCLVCAEIVQSLQALPHLSPDTSSIAVLRDRLHLSPLN